MDLVFWEEETSVESPVTYDSLKWNSKQHEESSPYTPTVVFPKPNICNPHIIHNFKYSFHNSNNINQA